MAYKNPTDFRPKWFHGTWSKSTKGQTLLICRRQVHDGIAVLVLKSVPLIVIRLVVSNYHERYVSVFLHEVDDCFIHFQNGRDPPHDGLSRLS